MHGWPKTSLSVLLALILATICASEDPDFGLSAPEIIVSRGFTVQTHEVVTADGYILVLYRIINPKNTENPRPIIMQHGVMGSANNWLLSDPFGHIDEPPEKHSNNMAFELAKLGYDIWLPNSRGNGLSTQHTHLESDSSEYWDFSFDEMINYDLPAVIEYTLNVTGRKTIGYVGHSQGTATMFGLMSIHPEYVEIVKPFIALAPVAYLTNLGGALVLLYPFRSILAIYDGPLKGKSDNSTVLPGICTLASALCEQVLHAVTGGYESEQTNKSRIMIYTGNEPLTTSAKNIAHYFYNYERKRFMTYYDENDTGIEKSKTDFTGSDYPVNTINSKDIALISATDDPLGNPTDVELLKKDLKIHGPLLKELILKGWGHQDVICGHNSYDNVTTVVIDLLDDYDDFP